MNIPKTAIIGADGFLGKAFYSFFNNLFPKTFGTSYKSSGFEHLDMNNPDISRFGLREQGYKHVLILAGIPKIEFCENNKDLTRQINVDGQLELVKQIHREGLFPICVSSDAVFSGERGQYTDDSETSAVNEYGRQKAEVEKKIRFICGENFLMLRLSKIFTLTKGDNTLLDEMAKKLTDGHQLTEAYDQIFCPMLLDDLVNTTVRLQSMGAKGIINVCGNQSWSRYQLAEMLAVKLGIPTNRIVKDSIDNIVKSSKRPHDTSMRIDRLNSLGEFLQKDFQECLTIKANQYKN